VTKTHPHLLVRDALAELFVAAAAGEVQARADVSALAAWRRGEGSPPELRAEDRSPLFAPDGALAPDFAELEPYVRDRAARFAAACAWLDTDERRANVLERAGAAWDAGLFFEVHEIVEPVWLETTGPARENLQGVIMAGAALHHLSNGNLAGARGLLGDAARRLEAGPEDKHFDLKAFAQGLANLRTAIDSGTIRSAEDVEELPLLERRGDSPS
jgi:predicted metal-dependent hydrolase